MQKLLKGNRTKKIWITILIVIMCNFIIPTYSHADVDGGVLFEPIKILVVLLGDTAMSIINWSFTGKWIWVNEAKVKVEGDQKDYWSENWITGELDWPTILITPEEIFSGKVLGLNVNFLEEKEEGNLAITEDTEVISDSVRSGINAGTDTIGTKNYVGAINNLRANISKWYLFMRNISVAALFCVLIYIGIRMVLSSASEEKAKYKSMIMNWVVAICLVFVLHYIMSLVMFVTDKFVSIVSDQIGSTTYQVKRLDENETQESFSLVKRPKLGWGDDDTGGGTVSSVYNLMEYARLYVNAEKPSMICAVYLLVYMILVVFTVIFVFKYLKRFMYMAFLTMIAPLVAFTYPLDKMGDGSAQAFNKWFTEYLFNALLQPLHLLIYVVLVGTAADLAKTNFIYAIAALAFINQAEKLLKEFFGLNRASTTGGSGGAFAAGALASNAINALKKGTSGGGDKSLPSGGSGGSGRTSGGSKPRQVRGLDAYSSGSSTDGSSGGFSGNILPENNHQEEPRWHPGLSQEQKDELLSEGLKPGDQEYNQYLRSNGLNLIDPPKDSSDSQDTAKPLNDANNPQQPLENKDKKKITGYQHGRVASVARAGGKALGRGLRYTGKKLGRGAVRTAAALPGAVAGGIIGGAMAVATGDAKYLAGGIAAGASLTGKAANVAFKAPSKIRQAYRQERLGSDAAASKARVDEFLKNENNINYFRNKYGFESENDVKKFIKDKGREFIGSGYTDAEDVDRLMRIQGAIGGTADQAMFTDNMASQMKMEDLLDDEKFNQNKAKFAKQIQSNAAISGRPIDDRTARQLAQKHMDGMRISRGLTSSNLHITEAERGNKKAKKQEKISDKNEKRQEKQVKRQTKQTNTSKIPKQPKETKNK